MRPIWAGIGNESTYVNEYIYLGLVQAIDEKGRARIEQKNKFCVGDRIEIMKPDGSNVETQVLSLTTEEGVQVESAPHSKQILYVGMTEQASEYDILRVAASESV